MQIIRYFKIINPLKEYIACSYFIILLLVLASCDDCADCGPLDTEPSVNIKLINADSIMMLSSIVAQHQATIENYNNELASVEQQLEDESLEEQERVELEARRDLIIADIQLVNDYIAGINPVLTNLRRGLVRIDTLYSPGGLRGITFRRDTIFTIPLRPDTDFSTLIFGFNNRRDTLTLLYQRKDTLMNERLRIFPVNLSLGDHTFNDTSRVINDRRVEVYY